jgi:hypothetical protein
MRKIVMQKIDMQKIVELNIEEAEAVAGGGLARRSYGDLGGGARYGGQFNGGFNRGPQLAEKKR